MWNMAVYQIGKIHILTATSSVSELGFAMVISIPRQRVVENRPAAAAI